MKSKDALGFYGEELAARYLSKNGLVILERNWRCDFGEIDVIARERSDLVICEVKTRRTVAYGDPIESVTPRKVRRMRGLALRWLDTQSVSPRDIRFDVVGILARVVQSELTRVCIRVHFVLARPPFPFSRAGYMLGIRRATNICSRRSWKTARSSVSHHRVSRLTNDVSWREIGYLPG